VTQIERKLYLMTPFQKNKSLVALFQTNHISDVRV
jgi:hypothetical protein